MTNSADQHALPTSVTNAPDQHTLPTAPDQHTLPTAPDQHIPARVSRESMLTGMSRTMELKKYSQEDFDRLWYAYSEGKIATLQQAFPLLSPNALEFLRSGTLLSEWDSNE
jgi:hypothetical protein